MELKINIIAQDVSYNHNNKPWLQIQHVCQL